MGDKTQIEWCDSTWNPIRGCSLVSAGCTNCYAMSVANRFAGPGQPYEGLTVKTSQGAKWTGKIMLVPKMLDQPLRWTKPRKIFVNSMSDLFHEGVPEDYIDQVFDVMMRCQNRKWNGHKWVTTPGHIFQILTKRPERMREYVLKRLAKNKAYADKFDDCPTEAMRNSPAALMARADAKEIPKHIQLGVSVEDQPSADERIPILLQIPAETRWLSMEPLLANVDISQWLFPIKPCNDCPCPDPQESTIGIDQCCRDPEILDSPIHWVVVGGESGSKARPMHPQWAEELRDQCDAAGVPFLFKQWGEWAPTIKDGETLRITGQCNFPDQPKFFNFTDGTTVARIGKHAAGRLLDGVEHNGYPK